MEHRIRPAHPGVAWRPSDATAQRCHEDESFRQWATAFLRHADLGINKVEIDVTEETVPKMVYGSASSATNAAVTPSYQNVKVPRYEPFFVHSSDGDAPARFELGAESQGTRRLFGLLAPLFDVLKFGQLAVIDEFGVSMHPSLGRELIRLFQDPKHNPNGAQLVFATHDTSLLSGRLFRRDQVWFTEKGPSGASDLYSLQDIKGVRENDPFEKGYLRGRYGAIPFFGEFDFPPVEATGSQSEDVDTATGALSPTEEGNTDCA
jgi:hypothetical protein